MANNSPLWQEIEGPIPPKKHRKTFYYYCLLWSQSRLDIDPLSLPECKKEVCGNHRQWESGGRRGRGLMLPLKNFCNSFVYKNPSGNHPKYPHPYQIICPKPPTWSLNNFASMVANTWTWPTVSLNAQIPFKNEIKQVIYNHTFHTIGKIQNNEVHIWLINAFLH